MGSLHARRSTLLSSIASMQAQRASLLSQGTDCPSVDALDAARRKLKVTVRRVAQLQLEHDHAVEDSEDTALTSTTLAHALAERRSAACAVDQHSLRLARASSRWPELRFYLGEDEASARSLEVFADQSTIAAGPPTTRFKVIRWVSPDGERAALKLFPLGSEAKDRATAWFMREAERLRRLKFDHIERVRDVFVHVDGRVRFGVLMLQYYERGDMQQWLDKRRACAFSSQVRSVLRDAMFVSASATPLVSSMATTSPTTSLWAPTDLLSSGTLTCRTMTGFV
mmetsp:Transcript_4896/g.15811  ORF Transcript_4896/g.15811 Transcript_4896/m.15811 type:complete len:283 (-) Transcript_4896:1030-1878(-)